MLTAMSYADIRLLFYRQQILVSWAILSTVWRNRGVSATLVTAVFCDQPLLCPLKKLIKELVILKPKGNVCILHLHGTRDSQLSSALTEIASWVFCKFPLKANGILPLASRRVGMAFVLF